MRLAEVTITNYRSIVDQTKFEVGDLTTLIGPNNEGKSNLIRALSLAMVVIQRWSRIPDRLAGREQLAGLDAMQILRRNAARAVRGEEDFLGYSWDRDFPLGKQEALKPGSTTIRLRFSLTSEDVVAFKSTTGIQNNGDLPLELSLGRSTASFGVKKSGRGGANHREKAREIAAFVSSRVSFVPIPAIRTTTQSMRLINQIAQTRLDQLTADDEYRKLVANINSRRHEVVVSLSESLSTSVKRYLQTMDHIEIETVDIAQVEAVANLVVDDGTRTTLENKGDGVKSLVAMALIHELSVQPGDDRTVVLAIDEPEAHLHPAAVHELQTLFGTLSEQQQVIVATHSPIFANRDALQQNVLVRGNRARPAENLRQIREALGVQLQDNLESAETVVLVEGISDEKIIGSLLPLVSKEAGELIKQHRVVLKAYKGVGKLRPMIQREKSTLCRIIATLDDDGAGRGEAGSLHTAGILPQRNVVLVGASSKTNSELEDLLNPNSYLDGLSVHFGRKFTAQHFGPKNRKWSDNFEAAAKTLGIALADGDLDKVKSQVAEAVLANPNEAWLNDDGKARLMVLADVIVNRQ